MWMLELVCWYECVVRDFTNTNDSNDWLIPLRAANRSLTHSTVVVEVFSVRGNRFSVKGFFWWVFVATLFFLVPVAPRFGCHFDDCPLSLTDVSAATPARLIHVCCESEHFLEAFGCPTQGSLTLATCPTESNMKRTHLTTL